VSRLLGAEVTTADQRDLLGRVGIATQIAPPGTTVRVASEPMPLVVDPGPDEVVVATVPTWRRDLEIEADVAEEVARVGGYETTPAHLPDTRMPAYRPSPIRVRNTVRETLAGAGLTEVVTHALVAPGDEARLQWPLDDEATKESSGSMPIVVTNPLAGQHSVLRRNLIGSLLDVLAVNEHQGRHDVAVFEIGKGYARTGDLAREWTRLGILLTGSSRPPAWNRESVSYDLDDGKGIVELLCQRLNLPAPTYAPDPRGFPFHPGRALVAEAASELDALVGRVAELHPDTLEAWDLKSGRVIVAELAIRSLDGVTQRRVHVEPIGRFPVVERDLAVIVSEGRPAAEVDAVIRRYAGRLLVGHRLFDLYRGAPLAADEKSLAYRMAFGVDDRTLTEEEADAALAGIRAALEAELGARIRS
jgi:phenylalanyl-tRNA synthetase beta chain